MTWSVEFDELDGNAVLRRELRSHDFAWNEFGTAVAVDDAFSLVTPVHIRLNWGAFLALIPLLRHLRDRDQVSIHYSQAALERLRTYREDVVVSTTPQQTPMTPEELYDRMVRRGWDTSKRLLTPQQLAVLSHLATLAHGANFSVPGAGKTTVTLALHLARLPENACLLVVAPKNAFPAWDEALEECTSLPSRMSRLTGGRASVEAALRERPKLAIISYAQLIRATPEVTQFLLTCPTHLVLDESHRIKAGYSTQTGGAALRLGPLALRRDILSGTPMPNRTGDLSPQFDFLWPGRRLGARLSSSARPREVIGALYARTTRRELGLPEPEVEYEDVYMSAPQLGLYGYLRNDFVARIAQEASGIAQPMSRSTSSSLMRLLQVAIDPQAAALSILGQWSTLDPTLAQLAQAVLEEGISPRLEAVIRYARKVISLGRKVVIWAPCVATIERLVREFDDVGAAAIHGGTPAGEDDEEDTREYIVRRFHDDPAAMVLVANPAAGGEGISLHKVCHDAIYVGRTYNAAHFLQSRDRIHRLGLPLGAVTRIKIFEVLAPASLGSIDMSVRRRLNNKVEQMGQILDDPDLRALALESEDASPDLSDGLTHDDLIDLMRELVGGGS